MKQVLEGSSPAIHDLDYVRSILREYYGRHLKSKSDLSQKACCTDESQKRFKDILELIPDQVKARHYGCGCPVPEDDLTGSRILDLGSGAGVDAFILSYLVGHNQSSGLMKTFDVLGHR